MKSLSKMMMNKPTILTYNFNGYDTFHSHFYTDNLNYVLVTDDLTSKLSSWDIQYPEILHKMTPWEKVIYVRYHPFEFTDSELVVVIDGSMVIGKYAELLIKKFADSEYDLAVPASHQAFCIDRVMRWYSRGRISCEEKEALFNFLQAHSALSYKGCLSGAIRLLKKTDRVMLWLEDTYEQLYKNGTDNNPIRLDEVVSTISLCKQHASLNSMILPNNIMNGEVFQYTNHKTGIPIHLPSSSITYFNDKLIVPNYIGPEYSRTYKYKSEAMCLTRYLTENGLREWIEHHLGMGFDHIHIFDNESPYPCKDICEEYKDKVSYQFISGNARHYAIFNDYINSDKCQSEWVIPIDDDEYFIINQKIKNVNACIDWYTSKFPNQNMFAIRWKHLFPKVFHTECDGPILSYCTEENPILARSFQRMGDKGIKTLVRRYGKIHYETTEENPSGGHVPKHTVSEYALLYNGEKITRCSCRDLNHDETEPARLIHCRYKGYTWYINKNKDIIKSNRELDNSSGKPYTHYYRFNDILETLK